MNVGHLVSNLTLVCAIGLGVSSLAAVTTGCGTPKVSIADGPREYAPPAVDHGQGLTAGGNHGPGFREYRIQLDKFTLAGWHVGFGEDRLGGAFRYAKRAIDTLFRVNRQKVVALVETIDGTDHHAVRVFALDAVLGNDKAHFRALLVGQRF